MKRDSVQREETCSLGSFMLYATVTPDPAESVSSVLPGYHFHCPNVTTVDHHIAKLRDHVGPRSNLTPKRKEAALHDIDQLLDRRLYLMLVG